MSHQSKSSDLAIAALAIGVFFCLSPAAACSFKDVRFAIDDAQATLQKLMIASGTLLALRLIIDYWRCRFSITSAAISTLLGIQLFWVRDVSYGVDCEFNAVTVSKYLLFGIACLVALSVFMDLRKVQKVGTMES